MEPEIAKRITASSDGQALVAYLRRTVMSLDRLSAITAVSEPRIALEVRSNQRAIEKLEEILSTLLTDESRATIAERSEYAA